MPKYETEHKLYLQRNKCNNKNTCITCKVVWEASCFVVVRIYFEIEAKLTEILAY